MLVKALISFAGKVSMYADETREIIDDEIAKDLLRAGYVEEVKAKAKEPVIEKLKYVEPEVVEPKAHTKKSSRKSKKK